MKNRSDTPLQNWLQPYNSQPDGGTPLAGEVTPGGWPCTSMAHGVFGRGGGVGQGQEGGVVDGPRWQAA